MYGQQSLHDLTFLMFYGGVALLAVVAGLYLLFRRANAIAPNITPPRVLRQLGGGILPRGGTESCVVVCVWRLLAD